MRHLQRQMLLFRQVLPSARQILTDHFLNLSDILPFDRDPPRRREKSRCTPQEPRECRSQTATAAIATMARAKPRVSAIFTAISDST